MAEKPNATFATLDGMRGFGALLVVIGHSAMYWGGVSLPSAPVVVDMFFLLSGYVIAFSYEPRFAKGMRFTKFMQQRVIRLYPLYAFGILLGAVVHIWGSIGDPAKPVAGRLVQLVMQMFMLPSPPMVGEAAVYKFDKPAWTLLFEMAINIVYILAWPALKTRVLAVIVAISAAALAVTAFGYGKLDVGAEWATIWGGFARVSFSFFFGVLIYRLTGEPKQPGNRRSWWALGIIVAIPVVSFLPTTPELRPALDLFIVVVIGPALIWAGQAIEPPKMFVKLFTFLGAISYALYILHYPIYLTMVRVGWRLPAHSMDWLQWSGPILLAFIVAVASVATFYYDERVRAWLNIKIRARDARLAAATAKAAASAPTSPKPR